MSFYNAFSELTSAQRKLAEHLAEIEQADADACAHCGGEDCACCEIYHDRQQWQSPEELFGGYQDDLYF